jgi:hypothetical protein
VSGVVDGAGDRSRAVSRLMVPATAMWIAHSSDRDSIAVLAFGSGPLLVCTLSAMPLLAALLAPCERAR